MTNKNDEEPIAEEVSFFSAMYGIDNAPPAAPQPVLTQIHGDLLQPQQLAALVLKQQETIEKQDREIRKLWAKMDHMARVLRVASGAIDDVYRELDTKVTIQDR